MIYIYCVEIDSSHPAQCSRSPSDREGGRALAARPSRQVPWRQRGCGSRAPCPSARGESNSGSRSLHGGRRAAPGAAAASPVGPSAAAAATAPAVGTGPRCAGQSCAQGCSSQRRSPSRLGPGRAAQSNPRPRRRRLPRCGSSLVSLCCALERSGSPFLMETVLCVTELTLGLDTCIS